MQGEKDQEKAKNAVRSNDQVNKGQGNFGQSKQPLPANMPATPVNHREHEKMMMMAHQ